LPERFQGGRCDAGLVVWAMPFREAANESAMTPGPDRFRAPDGRAIGAYSRAQVIWFYGLSPRPAARLL